MFLSGIFFPCCQYALFANATQFAVTHRVMTHALLDTCIVDSHSALLQLACVILPPCVMVAEATAPHTLDTVSLIIVAAGIMLALFHLFPDGSLSPHGSVSCAR